MQGARRFFISNQGLEKDLVLSGTEHNHLAHVLRLHIGDEVVLVCGDKFDYHYTIASIAKSQSKLTFEKKSINICNPKTNLTVFMGVIKYDNLALAVEKLNEIGVTEIVLFKSAHCQNIQIKKDKLQTVANQSCKQCGRSIPLKVSGVLSFDELLKSIPKGAIFADEKETAVSIPNKPSNAIIIGTEGGFTDVERTALRKFATPVTLGARILRAETAAIVGATILMSKLGEL